ncbi:YcgJ family protein [Citrobacter koseri]|uniref:YcgJ family protein n=1 Tax=Citrobacter koseri TaxID=545 RepID=UPI001F39D5F8|nr:YcgJ family protein [Citrobacter koseri]
MKHRPQQAVSCLLVVLLSLVVGAYNKKLLQSPEQGVLCDTYVCADGNGISGMLTAKSLGKQKADHLAEQRMSDLTEFTYENGIFCDVKVKLCRKDRYYEANGKRSGIPDAAATQQLFGQ